MKFRFCASLPKSDDTANPELTFHIHSANLQKLLSSSDSVFGNWKQCELRSSIKIWLNKFNWNCGHSAFIELTF